MKVPCPNCKDPLYRTTHGEEYYDYCLNCDYRQKGQIVNPKVPDYEEALQGFPVDAFKIDVAAPNGIHHIKITSGIRVTYLPNGKSVFNDSTRSQIQNRNLAMKELTDLLKEEFSSLTNQLKIKKRKKFARCYQNSFESIDNFIKTCQDIAGQEKCKSLKGKKKILINDKSISIDSQRYILFGKNRCCIKCGLKGVMYALEQDVNEKSNAWHFNLYGFRDGQEVIMTKDHIKPKSKGGKDNMSNYQTMCIDCNEEKGNKEGDE